MVQPCNIRAAMPGDEDSVARVHVRTWQAGYRGLLPDAYLDGLDPADRARRYTFADRDPTRPQTLVALVDDRVVGFATTMPTPDADGTGTGELAALHVDPDHWRGGIGLLLVRAARAQLIERGFARAVVWVLHGNDRALRFYAADGWRPDGTRRSDVVWGASVDERRLQRSLP